MLESLQTGHQSSPRLLGPEVTRQRTNLEPVTICANQSNTITLVFRANILPLALYRYANSLFQEPSHAR
jgi:hypothetical protein